MNTWRRLTDRRMTAFVDTSGLYALLDRDDAFHERAGTCWRGLSEQQAPLVTHNYVLVETIALTHRRLGPVAVRALKDDVFPVISVFWVDEGLHNAAMTALIAAARQDISLVDWVSFEAMRLRGVQRAFTFDRHFLDQGFTVLPGIP